MRKKHILIFLLVLFLSSCATTPSELRPYLRCSHIQMEKNIITTEYLKRIAEGKDSETALREAREYTVMMTIYLYKNNPEHLFSGDIPKIRKN